MSSKSGNWPVGIDRVVLEQVDSTNAEARRRAATLAAPVWILGLHQTEGRGRRGRAWSDPDGNFAATFAFRPPGTPQDWAQRSFAAALALRDALELLAGSKADLTLKWPNDVLLDGAKVAGILLESDGDLLCIGIGVNLEAAPDPAVLETGALPATSVQAATGVSIGREELLDALAAAFAEWESRLNTYGFEPLRRTFLQNSARRGQSVTVKTTKRAYSGLFTDIDSTGAIVLDTDDGQVGISAGDVFF